MKYLRHCLVGLFLLTGACGGSMEEPTETPAPGGEAGQEATSDNGGPTSQALCDYEYSYGSCGSCSIAPISAPGQVSSLAYPGQTSRRRYCCYTNGTNSCGSWQSTGCNAC
ncbi:hypothetical protein [Cystobacter ferrugineus]|uniref:hypothetical protein n=1 Tax=Cystobacter ferrugineus TaxID=83449 RepID=UPI000A83E22A|nr:hypothetical protein [Cystobacter ferrugineus]